MALSETAQKQDFLLRNLPRRVLAPLPLPLIQPLLQKIVRSAAQNRPEMFRRLGPHRQKTYLIDPVNMPFVLVLRPDADSPSLRACRRRDHIPHDARIAGSFLTLLRMIDGRLDGDALFFSRDLIVEGDTEAIVVLRNAMDDLDGSIADEIAAPFGPVARAALSAMRRIRT